MRSLCIHSLAVALLALLALPVLAQQEQSGGRGSADRAGFGRRGMAFHGAEILRLKRVREELNLTQEQAEQLRKKAEQVYNQHREQLEKARKAGDRQEVQKLLVTIRQETNNAVAQVLKPQQALRYWQIQTQVRLQLQGPRALLRSDDWRELDLNPRQRQEVRQIADELDKDRQDLFRDVRGDRDRMTEAFKKDRQRTQTETQKALGVLTSLQRDKWQELTGKKFQITPEEIRELRLAGRRGQGAPHGEQPSRSQPRE